MFFYLTQLVFDWCSIGFEYQSGNEQIEVTVTSKFVSMETTKVAKLRLITSKLLLITFDVILSNGQNKQSNNLF